MSETTACQHYEIVKFTGVLGQEIGTCQYCGQRKLYYYDAHGFRRWEILTPGSSSPGKVAKMKDKRGPHGHLGANDRKELVEVGVDEFARRHGYKHKGSLTTAYKKLTEGQEMGAEDQPKETPTPAEARDQKYAEHKSAIQYDHQIMDTELKSMNSCVDIIEQLGAPVRKRIVAYLSSRYLGEYEEQ